MSNKFGDIPSDPEFEKCTTYNQWGEICNRRKEKLIEIILEHPETLDFEICRMLFKRYFTAISYTTSIFYDVDYAGYLTMPYMSSCQDLVNKVIEMQEGNTESLMPIKKYLSEMITISRHLAKEYKSLIKATYKKRRENGVYSGTREIKEMSTGYEKEAAAFERYYLIFIGEPWVAEN